MILFSWDVQYILIRTDNKKTLLLSKNKLYNQNLLALQCIKDNIDTMDANVFIEQPWWLSSRAELLHSVLLTYAAENVEACWGADILFKT